MITSPTYKQLEARLRIGAFTLRQWCEILLSATLALLFAMYVSPFDVTLTIFLAIVVSGVPIAVSYGAMSQEWSVLDAMRAQWGWFTNPRRRLPGPGADTPGYLVMAEPPSAEEEGEYDFVGYEGATSSSGVETETRGGALWDF